MDYPHSFQINCIYSDLIDKSKDLEPHQSKEDKLFSCQCRIYTIRSQKKIN